MPVFAIGREVFAKNMADHMQFAASNVTGGIGPTRHWIMEENPQPPSSWLQISSPRAKP